MITNLLFLAWLVSCVAFIVVWWATVAGAGTITLSFGAPQTLTTTAAQDAGLARLLTRVNATRDPADRFATVEAWLRDVLQTAIQSYRAQADQENAGDACAAYKALTAGQRNTIDTQLGGKSPCP